MVEIERFQFRCSVFGAMPTPVAGKFSRGNRYTDDGTALASAARGESLSSSSLYAMVR